MKKYLIAFAGAISLLLMGSVYANGALFVSAEVQCMTGKGPAAQSVLVGAEVCAFPFPGCFNPLDEETRGQIQGENIPCALAHAITNWAIAGFCAENFGVVIENIVLNFGDLKSDTTSLVLPNGNTLHQWNFACGANGAG